MNPPKEQRTVDCSKHEATIDRLLDVKDTAHYGVIYVSGGDLKAVMRNAKALVDFAATVLRRR